MKKTFRLFSLLLILVLSTMPLIAMANPELGFSMVNLEIVTYTMEELSSDNVIYESQAKEFFLYENRIIIEFFIGELPYDSGKVIFYREDGNVVVYLNPKMVPTFIVHFQEQVIKWDTVNMVTFVNKHTKEEFFATDDINYNTYITN